MTEKENKVNQIAKEVSDLNFKIKLDTIKLKKIKEQLIDLMVNESVSEIITDTSKIKKSKWSVRFSTQLRKEFYKLDDKKKEELLSKDLLKIYYRLNSKKYEEIKNKQEKTELDEYIIDRKNLVFLTIRLNEQSRKELTNGIETKEDAYDERKFLEKSFLEEIEGLADEYEEYVDEQDRLDVELMDEVKPDPYYFSDDDPEDMNDIERNEKGYEEEKYSEEEDEDDQDERK